MFQTKQCTLVWFLLLWWMLWVKSSWGEKDLFNLEAIIHHWGKPREEIGEGTEVEAIEACCILPFSVTFLIQPRPTFSGIVPPQCDGPYNINLQSAKYPIDTFTGQCDGDDDLLRFPLQDLYPADKNSLSWRFCSFGGIFLNLTMNFT